MNTTTRKWLAGGAIGLAFVFLAALIFVRFAVGWFFVIPQNGMYPGHPAGSQIFALKRPYADISQVAHGDIVLFEREQSGSQYVYICRVVGLPGETVEADGNRLRIDGKEVTRRLIRQEGPLRIESETIDSASYHVALGQELPLQIPESVRMVVPPGRLFVMGDNRQKAVDSRIFGPISFRSVFAKKW